ncbi:unnamed protein product [Vitrella brassicaformis CCMP3155]|uniref:Uncharacterized protein n=1 Tax=Vitrella brassicaformis (strain CCMP3155) TaxID=1169540 RepID=A0A0G4GKS1_VITBC|nr:unnamed protein product [Vitrella brassicaformis CCMP3155]|eukprot:CEM30626.1 unnamed protein product [Vitrella brassicaformis CCMP3155]
MRLCLLFLAACLVLPHCGALEPVSGSAGVLLQGLGALTLLKGGRRLTKLLGRYVPTRGFDWRPYAGDWAVITGASYGIGRSYALALARRGVNVVLIARSRDKLQQVARECEHYGVQARVVVLDLFETSALEMHKKVERALRSLPHRKGDNPRVTILINNVGGIGPSTKRWLDANSQISASGGVKFGFLDLPVTFPLETIQMNIEPMVTLTHAVLPIIKESICDQQGDPSDTAPATRRKKGIVLNVSSIAALIYLPFIPEYCASKAFVNAWTGNLAWMFNRDDILMEAAMPGTVATPLTRGQGVDADEYAEYSLKRLGLEGAISVPHPTHARGAAIIRALGPAGAVSTMQRMRRISDSAKRLLGCHKQ